jgi:predicted AAA+ superfamily ATPase
MIITRKVENLLRNKVKPGKVVVLHGARRVGKTFLIKEFLKRVEKKYIFWNGEDFAVQELLSRRSVQNYKTF